LQAPLLAFLAGIPALIYQVVWTREVALLAGIQLDAIATVVATFFGGLAIGSRLLGQRADGIDRPLRFYAGLELLAAALAVVATLAMRALGASDNPLGPALSLFVCGALILPATLVLGGTQPALLRSTGAVLKRAALPAGRIQGLHTAGAVVGVGIATLAIPALGLQQTLWIGAVLACGAAGLAVVFDRRTALRQAPADNPPPDLAALPTGVLALAAVAGVATLGFEVAATRMAAIRLGSSLYVWALVLALFLTGLAAGNLSAAAIAARTRQPIQRLFRLEIACSLALVLGLLALHPNLAASAGGIRGWSLIAVALGVLPGAFCMGAAFPLFARLVIDEAPGRSFGALGAWNTAGGIVGALLVPLWFLPAVGMVGTTILCAAINLGVGIAALALEMPRRPTAALARRASPAVIAFGVLAGLAALGVDAQQPAGAIHIEHGRHASAVIVSRRGERELIVDGDLEAHTAWRSRRAQELLAAIPLGVHPQPRRVLEIGFGAGITLGAAGSFPIDQLECVEISQAVLRAAPWMEPVNRGVERHPRLTLYVRDARSFLRSAEPAYDVVIANTLHPWSLGATGLYSLEYFERLRRTLATGGIAAQWIPVAGIRPESFRGILRSFFGAFEQGAVFWGEDNVILLGAAEAFELPDDAVFLGRLAASQLDAHALLLLPPTGVSLSQRRIAEAQDVRAILPESELLRDDCPQLEADAARGASPWAPSIHELLIELAGLASDRQRASDGMLLWLEARAARINSDPERAGEREKLAQQLGFGLARRAGAERLGARAVEALTIGELDEAERLFSEAEQLVPVLRSTSFGRAELAERRDEPQQAIQLLERWLVERPQDPEAWNQLANVLASTGAIEQAERAVSQALELNPFFPEALANAGLLAIRRIDLPRAHAMRDRLAALEYGQPRPELLALDTALGN